MLVVWTHLKLNGEVEPFAIAFFSQLGPIQIEYIVMSQSMEYVALSQIQAELTKKAMNQK